MGIKLFSSSSYDRVKYVDREVTKIVKVPLPNPDPKNFKIIKSNKIGTYLVVMVNYPDCTNYEGNKILIYYNCSIDDLLKQGSIDPHFSENKKFFSPIARFEPTDRGWTHARLFCEWMQQYTHVNY